MAQPGGRDAEPGTRLAAVVLAGGGSCRMGTDKAVLRIEGQRLVDRVVARLGEVAGEIVVVAGPDRRLEPEGAREIPDEGLGPLGGILVGLEAVTTRDVAVVAVDHPDPCPALLVALAARRGAAPCAAPVVDGRLQPLHAVWARRAAPAVRGAVAAGERSPTRLLQGWAVERVGAPLWRRYDPSGRFARGWNRPDDLDDRAER